MKTHHLRSIILVLIFSITAPLLVAQDTIASDASTDNINEWVKERRDEGFRDHGPIYVETIKYLESGSDNIILEPFNTVSAALFVLIAAWFLYRYRKGKMHSAFILYCIIMLMIGGISGTIYHALRVWPVFMYVDGGTIGMLMFSFTAWIIYKLIRNLWIAILAIPFGIALTFLLMYILISSGVNFNPSLFYAIMGIILVIPLIIYLFKTSFRGSKYIGLALLAFSIAIFSRAFDLRSSLPMGSHFLWHISGALATVFMFYYAWSEEKIRLSIK
ncbi:MAG: hypothetical protein U9R60_01075 [Bacteroidota bacterium]|nr:hypothetical protein [Bacteroidota bacterium]